MTKLQCVAQNCPLAENGQCLEGIQPPANCPNTRNLDQEIEDSSQSVIIEPVATPEPHGEPLPPGEDLVGKDLTKIMHRFPCTMIIIAGEVSSGKTTLLVELYNAFQNGPFGDFYFAGSETLIAFERRSYLSRVISGLEQPDTSRTPRSESLPFLHLKLFNESYYDLLFSDLSGEVFSEIADSLEMARLQTEIKRADHFVAMLDGEQLTDLKFRQAHVSKMADVLQSLVQENVLQPPTQVHLVASKWDCISKVKNASTWVENAMVSLEKNLTGFNISKSFIAARSSSETIAQRFQLDNLLQKLANRKVAIARKSFRTPSTDRAFLQYQFPFIEEQK